MQKQENAIAASGRVEVHPDRIQRQDQVLYIPLELIEYSAQNKLVKPLKALLALKFAYNGQVRLSDVDYRVIGSIAGFKDIRTVKKHIRSLLDLNWCGTDNQWLFIRGFERIRIITGATTRTAIEATPTQVRHILEYAHPAKILSIAKAKRRYAQKRTSQEATSAIPNTPEPFNGSDPYPDLSASCSLIGQWYGLSASTACRMKHRATKLGYTSYHHRYQRTGVHKSYFGHMAGEVNPERLTVIDDEVVVRLTDVFKPANYKFSTRAEI